MPIETNTKLAFFKKKHNKKTTIGHWQLRDLICVDKGIVSPNQNSVDKLLPQKESLFSIFNSLSFNPVSLSVNGMYIAAGGLKGEVMIKNLETYHQVEIKLEPRTNNSIKIVFIKGEYYLFVANNSGTVSIYSLPRCLKIKTILFGYPINSISVSEEKSLVVFVGDNEKATIYNFSSDCFLKKQITFNIGATAGFSVDWNRQGTNFAIGCQEAFVGVWDSRYLKESKNEKTVFLAKIDSTQKNGDGVCRAVRFSQNGVADLLSYTEHRSFFNIVDTRTFEKKQAICISEEGYSLTGLSFSKDSTSLFIGQENCIWEYNTNLPERRMFSSKEYF